MDNKKEDIFIKDISIENFKSIKKIDFKAKRINLFIGKPNVGKSNILEAFVFPAASGDYDSCKTEEIIRFKEMNNLFYFENIKNNILIKLDNYLSIGRKQDASSISYLILDINNLDLQKIDLNKANSDQIITNFNEKYVKNGNVAIHFEWFLDFLSKDEFIYKNQFYKSNSINRQHWRSNSVINFYKYKENITYYNNNNRKNYLSAPFGNNILEIINQHKDLKKIFTKYFLEYNLKLIINSDKNEIKLLRTVDSTFDEIPFELIADTLKRMIFYVTAIESNSNAIILLEEPEANCYPTYVADLAKRIVKKDDNQYFIATHSPIFIHEILDEDKKKETAIHIVYYEDDQTKIKTLSDEELDDIESYGYDLFFNEAHFLNDTVES